MADSVPDFSLERACAGPVCGLDEVGRAPVAGPVVAACVHIPSSKRRRKIWREVNDSKILQPAIRESLDKKIRDCAIWAVGEASPEEIETLNIVQASFLAMGRAYEAMSMDAEEVMAMALIDGHIVPAFPCPAQPVVKGDGRSVSIAAASIVAKVHRDGLMRRLAEEHPHYGWESNAGYPTRSHLEAIDRHGITPYHRRSFAPVRNFIAYGVTRRQLEFAV